MYIIIRTNKFLRIVCLYYQDPIDGPPTDSGIPSANNWITVKHKHLYLAGLWWKHLWLHWRQLKLIWSRKTRLEG